jgi:4-hydroxybenzoate polyprenyltransferase
MGRIIDYFSIMRPYQWYKNLVIFIALFFTGSLFNLWHLWLTILGFISLSFVSSSNYIFNDILDFKSDSFHPEKKKRPIAAGRVSLLSASVISAFLLFFSLIIAYNLSGYFFLSVVGIFILTSAYSIGLKNEPFLDIILIGANFVLRAVSGAFIIAVVISPWLIIIAFFLAVFLAVSKRKSDSIILGKNAEKHKSVFSFYTPSVLDTLTGISASVLIIAFSLYSFLRGHNVLLILLPILTYMIFRYISLVNLGSAIGRHPHLVYKDARLLFSGIISFIILLVVLYV